MNKLRVLRTEIAKMGYEAHAVVDNYVFADVLATQPRDRSVALAAFTQTPPSYRSAALAVVDSNGRDAAAVVSEHRALGAPLLFVIEANNVTVWQVRSDGPPRRITHANSEELPALFAANRDAWSPLSIHRAKSIGAMDRTYQLDFVDVGLLPVIESEIHAKLDRLLSDTLTEAARARGAAGPRLDDRALFRTTFRLLAAKVLKDRGHEVAHKWDQNDIDSVLNAISTYYRLPRLADERTPAQRDLYLSAWSQLSRGINFRNISADDLAFVYENTLVSPETRKHFGTHSTPRQVAEFVVGRLELWRHDPSTLHVYEPFAGAGVFLVAALRHLRDLLPIEWTDKKRHDFLVQRIAGDELDAFAAEVATLSLILADYPNSNGWKVSELDLFDKFRLEQRLGSPNVVLCNPPFESFTEEERIRYPEAAARSYAKPIAVLDAVLASRPLAMGFVLPRPFLAGKQYEAQRKKIEDTYKDIEVVSLPDRTFKASVIRSSLLIAHSPRSMDRAAPSMTSLRTTVVSEHDRDHFLRTGAVSETRSIKRSLSAARGDLWIGELDELWRYLADYQRFDAVATVHRGIEWRSGQRDAVRSEAQKGFVRGIHAANALQPFILKDRPTWLDTRPERLLYKAIDLPWSMPKVVANAARISRGPWCLAAAIDTTGMVASQQLFGIWPRDGSGIPLDGLCAILNGPLGNAYIAVHSPPDRIRVSALRTLPIPRELPDNLSGLVLDYVHAVSEQPLFGGASADRANHLLSRIDGAVLAAYDLPPRMERTLLEHFRGATRPTPHPWVHWLPDDFSPALRLQEYLSADFTRASKPWPLQVFEPLPPNEAVLMREYMGE
jgi:hypothetical protein